MQKLKIIGVGAVLGLFAVIPNNLMAQVEVEFETLNVALVASVPGEEVMITKGKGDNEEVIGFKTLKPAKVKINNKTILQRAAAPNGSKLVLMGGSIGSMTGVDTGTFSEIGTVDVVSGVVVSQGQSTEVNSSTENSYKFTAKSAFQSEYVATLTVAGEGLNFFMTGLATEKNASSYVETDASAKSSDSTSFLMNGVGEGLVTVVDKESEESVEISAILSGKIQSNGKASLTERFNE